MPSAIETLSFIPTGATTKRSLGAWTGDVFNVKNFGAAGDGSTDDTAAIQACLNAAYSNGATSTANKPVFFPAGDYIITHPLYILNTGGAHVFGAGMWTTKITNTGGTNVSFTASIAAALPDFNYSSVMTVTAVSSGTIYRGTLVSGGTTANPTIVADQLTGTPGSTGTYIVTPQGSAVGSTAMTGTNNSALLLDGVAYSTFEEFFIAAASGGVAIEWSWSRTTTSTWAAQIMLFKHIFFQGGDYGCRVGVGQQCDTSTWINCFFGGAATAGFKVCNFNAIGQTVLGGNFASNAIGIHVIAGSVTNISGVNFEVQSSYDIVIDGGAGDDCAISGCSSESTNFCSVGNPAASVVVTGCAQRSLADGQFLSYAAPVTIEGCRSTQGRITNSGPRGSPLRISNSIFYRTDALNYTPGPVNTIEIVQTYFGNPIDSIADRWGRKRLSVAGTRTYDIEAQALTDTAVLYSSASIANDLDNTAFTVNISTPAKATFTLAAHSFRADLPVAFKTSGALPTGLTVDTTYYVAATNLGTNTFELTTTKGTASTVVTSGSQSGAHTIRIVREYTKGDHIMKNNVVSGGSPGWYCTTAGEALATAVFKAEANVA